VHNQKTINNATLTDCDQRAYQNLQAYCAGTYNDVDASTLACLNDTLTTHPWHFNISKRH